MRPNIDQSEWTDETVEGPEIELKSGSDGPSGGTPLNAAIQPTIPHTLADQPVDSSSIIEFDLPGIDEPFRFDTASIEVRPSGRLPQRSPSVESFDLDWTTQRLVETHEVFEEVQAIGTRHRLRSATWMVEVDETRGLLTAHSRVKKPRSLGQSTLVDFSPYHCKGSLSGGSIEQTYSESCSVI